MRMGLPGRPRIRFLVGQSAVGINHKIEKEWREQDGRIDLWDRLSKAGSGM